MKLIFEENFNQKTLNKNIWNIENAGNGFGNNEWQFYTNQEKNIQIINNQLVITAYKENYEHRYFTSGKITTKGKFFFKYGRIDIKAKLPKGKGLWPALWMMPENSQYGWWPSCGEIDIMESLGHQPEKIYGTIHYGIPHYYHGGDIIIDNPNEFHTYSLIWEESEITWLIDNQIYAKTSNWFSKRKDNYDYPAPFNQDFYLIINLAVGGNFSGYPNKETIFPVSFIIDSIKVYQ